MALLLVRYRGWSSNIFLEVAQFGPFRMCFLKVLFQTRINVDCTDKRIEDYTCTHFLKMLVSI